MKATMTKEAVFEALQKMQNVVGAKTTLPILLNTLVEAGEDVGGLRFTATDMDISIRASVDADVERKGRAALPARRLFAIFRELPAGTVSLVVDERRTATIEAGKARFALMGMDPEEFPAFPEPADGTDVVIAQAQLAEMLRRTSYASSVDETRQALNGILFKLHEGRLTLVATDGRRLALAYGALEETGEKQFEVIIPTKAVREVERMLNPKGDLRLTVAPTQAVFAFCEEKGGPCRTVLVTRLVDGAFPNYEQVIPSECRLKAVLRREAVLECLRRVSLLANERSGAIRFQFGRKTLTISANTPDVGEAEDSLEVDYGGEPLEIGFNPQYIMEPLRNLDTDEVTLEMSDELSPSVLRASEPFLYVLMPMRLS